MEKVMRKHMEERLSKVSNFELYPPLPQKLNIELNNTCNQSCVFCPYHGKYAKNKLKPAALESDFVKKMLFKASELGIGKKEIGFYLAGEPFLYKDIVEIIDYAKQLGFEYTFLTTNAALATHEKGRAVIDAGLDSIRFSVNASDRDMYREVHGRDDFEKVVDNIRYISEYIKKNNYKTAISLSCVLTKKTIGIKNEIKKLFEEYVDDIMFIPVMLSRMIDMQEIKQEYQLVDDDDAKINLEFVCPLLFDTMIINARGQVVPCCGAYDTGTSFADLHKSLDFRSIWHNKAYEYYRKIFTEGASDKNTVCENCILRMKGFERFYFDD